MLRAASVAGVGMVGVRAEVLSPSTTTRLQCQGAPQPSRTISPTVRSPSRLGRR